MKRKQPAMDRIMRRVTVSPDGCWEFNGNRDARGYGRIFGGEKNDLVHRVVYQTLLGLVPEGLQLDHLCRNRACCNPEHLEPVTPRENQRRSPVSFLTLNSAKTHCAHGHPFDEANTYIYNGPKRRGRRICRACRQIADAKRRAAS